MTIGRSLPFVRISPISQTHLRSHRNPEKHASRMHTEMIYDLNADEAILAFQQIRNFKKLPMPTKAVFEDIMSIAGGRMSYLSRIAHAPDVLGMARHILEVEKGWLLSRIGLVAGFDGQVVDDVSIALSFWALQLTPLPCLPSRSKSGAHVPGCSCKNLSKFVRGKSRRSRRQSVEERKTQMPLETCPCRRSLM